jgi:hypothetical protein
VTGIFRQKNASNTFLLFIYGLLLKLPIFLHPQVPVVKENAGVLYRKIVGWMGPAVSGNAIIFSILTFLLLYLQAIHFNKVFNDQRMHSRHNYLAGMSYLLITSLFPEWNLFTPQLIINSILIWIWAGLVGLYNKESAKTNIYNIGIAVGLLTFLYWPAIAFTFLLLFALLLIRPFKLAEWLIALMGMLTPFYFWIVYLYVVGHLNWATLLPVFRLNISIFFQQSPWVAISVLFIILPFVTGGYFIQRNLPRMLIQVRKNWSILLLYLLIALFVPIINTANNFENWILCAVPFAAFHACAYFYPAKKWFAAALHWATVLYIVIIQYVLTGK